MNQQIKKIIENLDKEYRKIMKEYREIIEGDIRGMSIYGTLTILNKQDGTIITNITEMDKKIITYLKDNIADITIGTAHIKKASYDLLNELGSILKVNSIDYILESINATMKKGILYLNHSQVGFIKVIEEINISRNINDYNEFKVNISIESDVFDLIG